MTDLVSVNVEDAGLELGEATGSSPGSATRDLGLARSAYGKRDAKGSALAHGAKVEGISLLRGENAPERHSKAGEFVKNIVLGGLDGIITTFAVVSGATGGGLGTEVILVLGFSNILADAMSMGVGDALSTKAENEFILAEKEREAWELQNYPEGEIKEMVEIMVERGMAEEDAEFILRRYAKYPDLYVDFMMNFELEMQVPGPDDLGWGPWKDGAITFSSFVFFGLFPLLAYAAFSNTFDTDTLFAISCVLSAIMFFILGTLKTKFTKQHWFRGGMEILAMGSSTAAVSYLVGWLVESALLARGGGVGGMH